MARRSTYVRRKCKSRTTSPATFSVASRLALQFFAPKVHESLRRGCDFDDAIRCYRLGELSCVYRLDLNDLDHFRDLVTVRPGYGQSPVFDGGSPLFCRDCRAPYQLACYPYHHH